MAFTLLKLKPTSGANQIKSANDAYSFMMHIRLSYQNKSRTGRRRSRRSTLPPHQTIAKFELGEPFERLPRQKAGFWIRTTPRFTF
jgi:hypothetical protein